MTFGFGNQHSIQLSYGRINNIDIVLILNRIIPYLHVLHPSGVSIASLCCSQNCLEQVLNIMRSIMARKVSHKDVANKIVPDDFVKPVTFGFGNQHSRKHVPDVFYLLHPCSRIQLTTGAYIWKDEKRVPFHPSDVYTQTTWIYMKFSHITRTGILRAIRITMH